ncbi:MAG: glycosyltransferase [Caulobacteraceae bacterium]|nr:glycosyltransferase [Caulobacteraceae bacterium]
MTSLASEAPPLAEPVATAARGGTVMFVLEDLLVGGAQRHSVGLVRALKSRFRFRVLGLSQGVSASIASPDLAAEIRVLGLAGMFKPGTWRALARVLDEERPDLIVTVNQIATVAIRAALTLSRVRCPTVVVFHSTDVKNVAGWIRTAPFMPATWLASALVYISVNQQKIWLGRGLRARRVELIRNGIEVERFTPPDAAGRRAARERLGFADGDYVIGLSAVFRYEKNHQQLVEAVAALRAAGVPTRAVLVGDGPKRPAIEQLVHDLGLGDYVLFAGMQPDVRPYLAAMDVGVICSTSIETLSLSALECMASGAPMVMSDIGGASEIIEDGVNGFLFPAGDTPALVDRLTRCAEPALRERLGLGALRTVREHFSYEVMTRRYAELFEDLMGKRRPEEERS